jgi:hypothetical protein
MQVSASCPNEALTKMRVVQVAPRIGQDVVFPCSAAKEWSGGAFRESKTVISGKSRKERFLSRF